MAQGFISSQGDRTTPGTGNRNIPDGGDCIAQRFQCPGSGSVTITELGIYCDDGGNTGTDLIIFIYTDVAGPEPGSPVSGAVTTDLAIPASEGWIQETGLSISLTGGTWYWLGAMSESGFQCENVDGSGSAAVIDASNTYPTLPDPYNVLVDVTDDLGIYAVYSSGGGGATIPLMSHHYTKNIGAN